MLTSMSDLAHPARPLTLIGIAATGVAASACVGCATNAINGWVSPLYFVRIMRWDNFEDIWLASIAQGIFEGICFGAVFSLMFAAGVGIITRALCSYSFAVRYLLAIIAGALVCWILGGLAAMGLAVLSPERYQMAFIGVPDDYGPMLKYAWVGGSIWGVQFGGFVSLVLALVILRGNWLRLHHRDLNSPSPKTSLANEPRLEALP